jgi:hypothetical protein
MSAALIMALGAACGTAGDPAAAGPDDVVTNTPGPDASDRGGAQKVKARDGLIEPRPIGWDKRRIRGDRTVDLFFWHGVEECYGIDHVDVDYRRRSVRVTLFEGRNPEAETCIEIAVRKVIRVHLSEPPGDRRVVDGAPGG